MNRKIRKAVFRVAGFGIRFLPATKAMPKELLPIVDKPLIQYAAEEAIAAGINTLIFVTGRNKRAIEDHFDANNELESMLRAKGKNAKADMVRNIIPEGVECIFVRQPEQLGLGHAVLCAERAVGSDPFAVLLADDFLTDYEPGVTADLVNAFAKTGRSQLSVMEVDGPDISKYGVVVPNGTSTNIAGFIEKPDASEAPSNLASIGRHVLTPDIFDILRGLSEGSGGEIQLSDAINRQAQQSSVETILKKLLYNNSEGYTFREAIFQTLGKNKYVKRNQHKGFRWRDMQIKLSMIFECEVKAIGIHFPFLPIWFSPSIGLVGKLQ